MAEELTISAGSKEEKYRELVPQIRSVVECETDVIANMANVASMLHETFGFWWTGFYRVAEGVLVLGPFQGKTACTRIPMGKGVCGTAALSGQIQVVPDVHQFPGHIACDSASNSEIVIPLHKDGAVAAVLDIDSPEFDRFQEADRAGLERLVRLLEH